MRHRSATSSSVCKTSKPRGRQGSPGTRWSPEHEQGAGEAVRHPAGRCSRHLTGLRLVRTAEARTGGGAPHRDPRDDRLGSDEPSRIPGSLQDHSARARPPIPSWPLLPDDRRARRLRCLLPHTQEPEPLEAPAIGPQRGQATRGTAHHPCRRRVTSTPSARLTWSGSPCGLYRSVRAPPQNSADWESPTAPHGSIQNRWATLPPAGTKTSICCGAAPIRETATTWRPAFKGAFTIGEALTGFPSTITTSHAGTQ